MRIKLKDGSVLNAPDGLSKVEYRDLLIKERPDLYSISKNPLSVAGDAIERTLGQSKGALVDILPAIGNKLLGDEEGYKQQLGEYAQKLEALELSAPRRYEDYSQAESGLDKALYGLESISEAVPQLGIQLGATGLGALGGSLAGPAGTIAGGATAGAIASAILNSPEVLNAVTNPNTGEVDFKTGALALAGVTALDTIGLGKVGGPVLKKMVLGKALEKVAAETGDGALMRSAKGFIRGAAAEAPTEAAQQAITLQAENYVQQNGDLFTEQNLQSILDAGIRGGLGGGIAGGSIDAVAGPRPVNPFEENAKAENSFSTALKGALDYVPQIKELQDALDTRHGLETEFNRQRQDDQLAAEVRLIQIERENARQRLLNAQQVPMPVDGANPDVIRPGFAANVSTDEGTKLAPIPAVDMGFKESKEKQGDLFKAGHQLKNFNNQEAYIPEALLKQEQRKADNAAKNATMNAGREAKRQTRIAEQERKQESIRLQQEALLKSQQMAAETAARAREVTLPPAIDIAKIKPADRTFLATKGIDVTGESVPVSEIREKVSDETADRLAKQAGVKIKFSKPVEEAPVSEQATALPEKEISDLSNPEIEQRIGDLEKQFADRVRDVDEKHIKPIEAKHGDVGKQWADSLRTAITSKKHDSRKLAKAFAISHMLDTLPSKSDYGFKLVDSIKDGDQEAQGTYQPMSDGALKGLFQISLSDNIDDAIGETTAHEFFHGIQDYLKAADPKAAKALASELGSDRDQVSAEEFSPQLQKLLKGIKDSKGRNAFQKMKQRGKMSGDEAQAYTYGAYADALMSGQKVGLMKPGLSRAFNFVSNFRKRTKNWANGAGFQTAEDVFSDVVSGKKAKALKGKPTPKAENTKKSIRKYDFGVGDEIKVGENPSKSEVKSLLDRSRNKELRGLEHQDGTVYVWDAADAVHDDIADMFGADYDVNDNTGDLLDKAFHIKSLDEWNFREANRRKRKLSTRADQNAEGGKAERRGAPEKASREAEAPTASEVRAAEQVTPAFKSWFSGSKIVDENGEPLLLYHGTANSFNEFKPSGSGASLGAGIYLTSNPEYAGSAAKQAYVNEFHGRKNQSAAENIMPLYASIKKPFDASRHSIPDGGTAELRKLGYDGIIAGKEFVAFSPEQIKSATGNAGTFDPTNPDIRFSISAFADRNPDRAEPLLGATSFVKKTLDKYLLKPGFDAKQTRTGYGWGFLDDWITAMTNHFRPVEKAVMATEERLGRKLADAQNPISAEVTYHGKVGNRLKAAQQEDYKPILQYLKANGIEWADFDEYLYAKHAKERNDYLRAKGSKAKDPSGMSDEAAKAAVKRLETPEMRAAAKMVYDLIKKTNKLRVDAGLLPKEFLSPQEGYPQYKNYVPLRGWEEDPEADVDTTEMSGTGSGFSISGKEDKAAAGRESRAAEILAHVFLQNAEAIIRAEKNKVGQAMLNLVQETSMPGVQVNTPDVKAYVSNGVIRYRAQMPSLWDKNRVFATKKNGKLYLMEFDDPHLAKALNNAGRESMNAVYRLFSKMNRYLASINTAWSPEFVISNFARDIQTAMINLSQYDADQLKWKVLKDVKKSFNAIAHAEGAGFWKMTIARSVDPEWVELYKEFLADGGSTEFMGLRTIEDIKADMKAMVGEQEGGQLARAKRALGYVGETLERHNQAVENATRLSVYANLRKAGATREKAAEIAKEITVNFNRKGTYGPLMNAAYLFYNAAVQGNAAFIRGAYRSKKFRKALGVMMFGGLMNDMVNRMIAGTDDKGENLWDKLPDYIKERNFVLMNPWDGTPLFMFPMPYGFNAVWNTGGNIGAMASGAKTPFKAIQSIASQTLNAFNPLGQGDLLSLAAPTLIDPWIEHAKNQDWSGKPIYPEDTPYGPPEPDAYKFWNNTGAVPKSISDALNKLTGGSDARSGLVDVSPETLTYIYDYVTGSAGSLVSRSAGLVEKILSGEEIEVRDVPFLRKLKASVPNNVDQITYGEYRDDVMTAKVAVDQARKERNPEKIRSILADEKNKLAIVGLFQRIDRRLSDLRNQIKNIDYNKAIPDTIKAERKAAIKEQMEKLCMQALKAYRSRVPEAEWAEV